MTSIGHSLMCNLGDVMCVIKFICNLEIVLVCVLWIWWW